VGRGPDRGGGRGVPSKERVRRWERERVLGSAGRRFASTTFETILPPAVGRPAGGPGRRAVRPVRSADVRPTRRPPALRGSGGGAGWSVSGEVTGKIAVPPRRRLGKHRRIPAALSPEGRRWSERPRAPARRRVRSFGAFSEATLGRVAPGTGGGQGARSERWRDPVGAGSPRPGIRTFPWGWCGRTAPMGQVGSAPTNDERSELHAPARWPGNELRVGQRKKSWEGWKGPPHSRDAVPSPWGCKGTLPGGCRKEFVLGLFEAGAGGRETVPREAVSRRSEGPASANFGGRASPRRRSAEALLGSPGFGVPGRVGSRSEGAGTVRPTSSARVLRGRDRAPSPSANRRR
jgi:hypothetical protein